MAASTHAESHICNPPFYTHVWPYRNLSSGPVYVWDRAISETLALRDFLVLSERVMLQKLAHEM